MVISTKRFDIMIHLEAEWPSEQNTQFFYSCFAIFFLQTQFRHNRRQKVFHWVASCWCRGHDVLKIFSWRNVGSWVNVQLENVGSWVIFGSISAAAP